MSEKAKETEQKDIPTMSGQQQEDATMTGEQQEQQPTFTGKKKEKKKKERPDFAQRDFDLGNDSNIADFLINQVMTGNLFITLHNQVADKLKLIPFVNGNNNYGKAMSCIGEVLSDDAKELKQDVDNMKKVWKDAFKGKDSDKKKDDPKKEKGKDDKGKKKEEPKKEKKKAPKQGLREIAQGAKDRKQTKDNKAKEGKRKTSGPRKILRDGLAQLKKFERKMQQVAAQGRNRNNANGRQTQQPTRPQSRSGRG